MKSKKIAIFMGIEGLERSSSIINLISSLEQNGYAVDIFSVENLGNVDVKLLFKGCTKIDLYHLERNNTNYMPTNLIITYFRFLINSIKSLELKAPILYFFYILIYSRWYAFFDFICKKIEKEEEYQCIIGIEKWGVILGNLFNYPLIYYSLELYYSYYKGIYYDQRYLYPLEKIIFSITRSLEMIGHEATVATIIQDKERADYIYKYNNVKKQKTFYLPVSMKGDIISRKTDWIYKNLNIKEDKKIFLQLGQIGPRRMSFELAKASNNWPDDWLLVLHGFVKDETRVEINKLKNENIKLSEDKVSFDKIPEVVSSSMIGLVFYSKSKTNFYNNYLIGSSSGQLAHFLQCGIPVITIDFPSLKNIVEKYQCGLTVSNLEEIEIKAKIIIEKYVEYSNNAHLCFKELYSFEKNFKPIQEFLNEFYE